jgi:hypothetical protein
MYFICLAYEKLARNKSLNVLVVFINYIFHEVYFTHMTLWYCL